MILSTSWLLAIVRPQLEHHERPPSKSYKHETAVPRSADRADRKRVASHARSLPYSPSATLSVTALLALVGSLPITHQLRIQTTALRVRRDTYGLRRPHNDAHGVGA